MPTSFQNLIARFFWPQLGQPVFTVMSQDVFRSGPEQVRVNLTARLQGQIPADQCAWLVEFVSDAHFHPKRALPLALPWQRYISESYLSSGNSGVLRLPAVIIVAKSREPEFWAALRHGRVSGAYEPQRWEQSAYAPLPAMGLPYTTLNP